MNVKETVGRLSVEDRKVSVLLIDPPKVCFSFEDTVGLAGHGRFHWLLLVGTGIGCMSIMIEDNCMAFVIPVVKCDLALTIRQQGLLYVASTMGFVCSSHLWGFVADTWGRRKVLRTALCLCCISSAASSFAANGWALMISRFVVGLWWVHCADSNRTISDLDFQFVRHQGHFNVVPK